MDLNLKLLSKQKKYVMGVSGGPDSMALLDMLRVQGFHLVACLVNYHVRSDSDLDYEVVKCYCGKHQIPLEYLEVFEYKKGNFEAQARKIRYDFFEEIAKKYMCEAVILAHHQDDFLETVLMQKARHMEDVFLGIREVSKYHDLNVIRPAMSLDKEDFLQYCHQRHIEYRIDSSNLENDYTRNYYRNEVLALYTKEMKQELYQHTLEENEKLRKQHLTFEEWLNKNQTEQGISVSSLLSYKEQESLLRYYLFQVNGMDTSKISKALVKECLKSLQSPRANIEISLPVNFVLIKEYDNMYVTKIKKEPESYEFLIMDEKSKDYGYFRIEKNGDDREGIALSEDDFPLTIRSRKQGDVIELAYGKKKLSRLFIDAKIPKEKRNTWPVVLNSKQEIILVPKIAKNKCYLLAKPTLFVIQ